MYNDLKSKHNNKIISFISLPVFVLFIGLYIYTDSLIIIALAVSVLIVISFSSTKWFNKHYFDHYLTDTTKRKEIYSFFSNKEMSNWLYYDAIIWLWWDLKAIYNEKHTQDDTDEEINALKLFIYEDVQSIAIKKRELFQTLCSELANEDDKNKRAKTLGQTYLEIHNQFDDNELIIQKATFKIKDISIFAYLAMIAFHFIGCFISDNVWENIFFYIPSDIILVLLFFNIINDKKQM